MDLLQGLNEQQRAAVTTTEGAVRVIAGAGSGKTRALTHRFAYLVNEVGILPCNILCVTFTNKSANEMKQRIRALTGDQDTGYISTFHGFCVSVLQEDGNGVQYPKSFLVLDNADIDDMLKLIYEERGLTLRDMSFGKARDMIEIRKLKGEPDYYKDLIALPLAELRQKYLDAVEARDIIFYGYLYQQKKCFGLDYNDLLKFVLYLFETNPAVRKKWQERLEYIMIDEFQDIDDIQYQLMRVLAGYHGNLFIVGDPDQTIYTWRGANAKYLLDFDKAYPNSHTIMMMQNYRSTPEILQAANSLIDKNRHRMKKDLLPTLPNGAPVTYHHGKTAEAEAKWIADRIRELTEEGEKRSNITVLYRAHYVSRTIEEVFLREKIPYTIYSGVPFFSRKEIKDALSYLRLIALRDDLSFLRVVNTPKRNIGERRITFLKEYAEKNNCTLYAALVASQEEELFRSTGGRKFVHMIENFTADMQRTPVSELLTAVLEQSGYEAALRTEGSQERLDNLAELKQSIHEYEVTCGEEATLEGYLAHAALMTNADSATDGGTVKLMTIHSAKGLEFPYVFLCGMSEGIMPSKKTATIEGMEEERRLAFVAFTRAQKGLFLSDSEGRNFDDSYRLPSRFVVEDVEKHLLEYTVELDEPLLRDVRMRVEYSMSRLAPLADSELFRAGERIHHSIFGEGTILSVDETLRIYMIQFDELDTPRKISWRVNLNII